MEKKKDPNPRNPIRKLMKGIHSDRKLKSLRRRCAARSLCVHQQKLSMMQKIVQTGKDLFNIKTPDG